MYVYVGSCSQPANLIKPQTRGNSANWIKYGYHRHNSEDVITYYTSTSDWEVLNVHVVGNLTMIIIIPIHSGGYM